MKCRPSTAVGDTIGYHNRKSGHSLNSYDWQQFLNFVDRHFGMKRQKNNLLNKENNARE